MINIISNHQKIVSACRFGTLMQDGGIFEDGPLCAGLHLPSLSLIGLTRNALRPVIFAAPIHGLHTYMHVLIEVADKNANPAGA